MIVDERKLLWVAGGRRYINYDEMNELLTRYHDHILITGSAPGADLLAEAIWKEHELPYVGVPARWSQYGRQAGAIRNHEIASVWMPDAFVAVQGGTGTAHARTLAKDRGIYSEE